MSVLVLCFHTQYMVFECELWSVGAALNNLVLRQGQEHYRYILFFIKGISLNGTLFQKQAIQL